MEENFNNQNRARRRCPLPVSFKGNLSNLIAAFADIVLRGGFGHGAISATITFALF